MPSNPVNKEYEQQKKELAKAAKKNVQTAAARHETLQKQRNLSPVDAAKMGMKAADSWPFLGHTARLLPFHDLFALVMEGWRLSLERPIR
jgi:hypothetical protein